jgi:hypothetical protein
MLRISQQVFQIRCIVRSVAKGFTWKVSVRTASGSVFINKHLAFLLEAHNLVFRVCRACHRFPAPLNALQQYRLW